jgi:hypothetical protein
MRQLTLSTMLDEDDLEVLVTVAAAEAKSSSFKKPVLVPRTTLAEMTPNLTPTSLDSGGN